MMVYLVWTSPAFGPESDVDSVWGSDQAAQCQVARLLDPNNNEPTFEADEVWVQSMEVR